MNVLTTVTSLIPLPVHALLQIKQLLAHAVHLEEVKHRGDMIMSRRDTKLKRVDPEKNASSRPLETSKAMDESIPITKDAPKNFLGAYAVKSKAAQNAKKAALIGIEKSSTKVQLSNTGSGVPLENAVKFKYQKGFTQAVRMPCSARDFM
jgi:sRNA-binding protein